MTQPRVWFITGASSGFGRCMTEHVLALGEVAVATLRTPSALDDLKVKYPSSQLLIAKCDVSEPEDITAAFVQMKQTFGRCDVVFNNAGYGVLGEVEGTPDDVSRKMFEVNFWGAVNVNREAVKFFREVNPKGLGGTLLVNSSVAGITPMPTLGFYGASKSALEFVTEALSKELDPAWNIRITIIEPGRFATKGPSQMIITPVHPAYTNPSLISQAMRNLRDSNFTAAGDPVKAAARFVEFVDAGKNGTEFPLHWALGEDSIARIGPRIVDLKADLDKSEGWSRNLKVESV